jgi:hypothetical protein
MTRNDINDLKVWKANLEAIIAKDELKVKSIEKMIHYSKVHPEVVCMASTYAEAIPTIIQKTNHLKKTINEINQTLEGCNEVNTYFKQRNAMQKTGFDPVGERDKLIQLQRAPSLLAN